jgi:hypothetical protein
MVEESRGAGRQWAGDVRLMTEHGANASGVWLSTEFRGTYGLTRLKRAAAMRCRIISWVEPAAKVNSLRLNRRNQEHSHASCRTRVGS